MIKGSIDQEHIIINISASNFGTPKYIIIYNNTNISEGRNSQYKSRGLQYPTFNHESKQKNNREALDLNFKSNRPNRHIQNIPSTSSRIHMEHSPGQII